MQEHHLVVDRTARYWTLGPTDHPVRQLWVVCHGFGQLAGRFIRHFAPLDDGDRLIVAPEALNRFYLDDTTGAHGADAKVGATWMTREDRLIEIADYVRYLDRLTTTLVQRMAGAQPSVHILGFSQGVATVTRWVARGLVRPAQVILWAGSIPPEIDAGPELERLRAVARLAVVVGTLDQGLQKAFSSGEADRLHRLGLDDVIVRFEGGHHLDAATLLSLIH